MSEMSIEEYRRRLYGKFGSHQPAKSDYCNQCGRTYGEHIGCYCPYISENIESEPTNDKEH